MELKRMNIQEIKDYIKVFGFEDYPILINNLSKDHRKTVQNLAIKLKKEIENRDNELIRINKMKYFESIQYKKGYNYIAGIDEVGRGPLAGPVVSAAVILPKDCTILGVNDSKKLSIKKREELYHIIKDKALDIGIGIVEPQEIDRVNIYQATKISMAVAVNNLKETPDYLLIDALKCDNISLPQKAINQGDCKSLSIAAASIIAKVTRDAIMDKYHQIYPNYCFDKNKGYGTLEHREGISNFGITKIHRRSFLKNLLDNEELFRS